MKLLALDTATEACSAALYIDGEIRQQFQMAPREHTQLILMQAQALLDEAGLSINQLDALAFGRGPGSFTGVRIAASVIQGMAFGADLPVLPVSTLASMAQLMLEQHAVTHVISAIDARMGGIYTAGYISDGTLMRLRGIEVLCAPQEIDLPGYLGWIGAGTGWLGHGDQLKQRLGDRVTRIYPDVWPQAATIARLAVDDFVNGRAVSAEQAQPVYLRDDVAKKSSK
ncbi:MAG: tRNA threonylcarbamoyladenosine biosynthesis protein TsaB [Pseudomonadota bacterium]|nr:tRNA threonylcarbamoyladenosine biosynthesis protein TsaB [Pseudomonadota bacterium]